MSKRRDVSLKKRLDKEQKINLAKEAAESVLADTRRRFAEREIISTTRRIEFERTRKLSFDLAKHKAKAKSIAMRKAFEESKALEEKRKSDALEVMRKAEIR